MTETDAVPDIWMRMVESPFRGIDYRKQIEGHNGAAGGLSGSYSSPTLRLG